MNNPLFSLLMGVIVAYAIGCLIFGVVTHYYNKEVMKWEGVELSIKEKITITFFWPIFLIRI